MRKRVTELQNIIDEMNRGFLGFNDKAVKSDILSLRPQLARELKLSTETFVRLAKAATALSDLDEDAEDAVEDAGPTRKASRVEKAEPSPVSSEPDRVTPPDPPLLPQHDNVDVGWGYTQSYPNIQPDRVPPPGPSYFEVQQSLSSETYGEVTPPYQPQPQAFGLFPFGMTLARDQAHTDTEQITTFPEIQENVQDYDNDTQNNAYQQYNFTVSSSPSPIHASLLSGAFTNLPALNDKNDRHVKAPYTYSFQETTFARRLHRAALEKGYYLLNRASECKTQFDRVFKLSLMYATRDQLINRIGLTLRKGVHDSLEFWQTPFLHLGGAGTHFPHRDASGAILPRPNCWNVRSIGPLRPGAARLENAMDGSPDSSGVELDISGYEGEWFDSHDVQGYLESLGVKIEPQASFAEGYLDVATQQKLLGNGDTATTAEFPFPISSNPLGPRSPTMLSGADSPSPGLSLGRSNSGDTTASLASPPTPDFMLAQPTTTSHQFEYAALAKTSFDFGGLATSGFASSFVGDPPGSSLAFLDSFSTDVPERTLPASSMDLPSMQAFDSLMSEDENTMPYANEVPKAKVVFDVDRIVSGESDSTFVLSSKDGVANRGYRTTRQRHLSWSCAGV